MVAADGRLRGFAEEAEIAASRYRDVIGWGLAMADLGCGIYPVGKQLSGSTLPSVSRKVRVKPCRKSVFSNCEAKFSLLAHRTYKTG